MANTNSAYRRIEAGATITFNDGTTTWTVLGIEPGTVEWELGWYKPLPFTDRGVMQTPYEGDERPGKVSMKVKYSGAQDINDLAHALQTRDTTTGKMKMWTIVIKNPAYKGSATGESLTFAQCYLEEGGVKIKAGTEFDLLEVSMVHMEVKPTAATY